MNTILSIAPWLALAVVGVVSLFRYTNALIAAEVARDHEARQRANARKIRKAWDKGQERQERQERKQQTCLPYPMHTCVFGKREGVEL